jgi:hypothetical protein
MAKSDSFLLSLREEGYSLVSKAGDDRWAGIMRFLFTVAIVEGRWGATTYEKRWCYADGEDAIAAFNKWMLAGFEDEPQGWHRSAHDGRRRAHGDPATEEVRP